ncbi:MAG: PAS domain-containing protein, partial [Dehalococcoidia bacterium]
MLDHQGRADGARQATAPDESERRFRALIEHSFDVIALLAIDGTILYASPSAQPMLGYAQGTVVGTSGFSLVHPEDVTVIAQLFSSLLTQPGTSVTSQFRIRRADGAWCWVESVETNLLQEPDVQAVVVNFRDISDRKAARAALEASEERYRCTFEDAGVGIAHVDLESRWLWVNPESCEIVDYRSDELLSL